jgi:hypothetical protein
MNIALKSAVALFIFIPLTAGAQSRNAITIAAGPSFPTGELRQTQAQGTDINLGLIRGSDDSPFGVRLDLAYDRFPGKTVNGIHNAERRVAGGSADLLFSTSGYTIKPYLIAGAGAFKVTSKPEAEDAKTRFGFDFGIGFTMPLGTNALFIESRLNSVSQHHARPLRYIPVALGFLF